MFGIFGMAEAVNLLMERGACRGAMAMTMRPTSSWLSHLGPPSEWVARRGQAHAWGSRALLHAQGTQRGQG